MRRHIPFAAVIVMALCASCPDGPGPSPASTDVLVPADFAGMCHAGYSSDLDTEYGMLDEMGVVWLHWDFSWWAIQSGPDTWTEGAFDPRVKRANNEGRKIIGMLLYGNTWVHSVPGGCGDPSWGERRICNDAEIAYFCEYAKRMVKRYNGQPGSEGFVDAWFIWNEPDLQPRFWTGTQPEFFALNKAVAETIRALDAQEGTHTTLVGGVFTALVSNEWIDGLFEHGAMDLVDGIGFHPYSPNPIGCVSVFKNFKERVRRYGFADKIWVNEMGYPTYSDKGPIPAGRYMTDRYEGDMPEVAAQTFALLAAAGAKGLTWYHLFDGANRRNNNSEDWFGLVWRESSSGWIKKGGYWGYAVAANNIPGKTYKVKNFISGSVPRDIYSYYFEGSDGRRTLLVWNNNPLIHLDVRIVLPGSNHKLWNLETGESDDADADDVYRLYPVDTYQKTMVFLTWEE